MPASLLVAVLLALTVDAWWWAAAVLIFLPWPLRTLAGPFNLFATTGFLAPEFRAMMKLDWSQSQQRRFEWLLAGLRLADRLIPHRAWIFGYQLYLWDMRSRARQGHRIV